MESMKVQENRGIRHRAMKCPWMSTLVFNDLYKKYTSPVMFTQNEIINFWSSHDSFLANLSVYLEQKYMNQWYINRRKIKGVNNTIILIQGSVPSKERIRLLAQNDKIPSHLHLSPPLFVTWDYKRKQFLGKKYLSLYQKVLLRCQTSPTSRYGSCSSTEWKYIVMCNPEQQQKWDDWSTPLSVSQVLNSHSHVMYILSILLAKYTEIKVSLKSRKTMDWTKLTTTKVWRLIHCN